MIMCKYKRPIVVFDDYKCASTKDVEHKRRKLSTCIADIEVRGNTPIPSNKAGFLDNKRTKQEFIYLLSDYLKNAGVNCISR